MSTVALFGPADCYQVRLLLRPGCDARDDSGILSDYMLSMPSIGGRAEAIVKQRLGADWLGFAATPLVVPAYYAQGDPVLAMQLVHDALVQLTCAQVVNTGLLSQLVATTKKSDDLTTTVNVQWATMQANFECAGYKALNLLRRAIPVAGRTFNSPSSGAAGQLTTSIRTHPLGSRFGERRCDW